MNDSVAIGRALIEAQTRRVMTISGDKPNFAIQRSTETIKLERFFETPPAGHRRIGSYIYEEVFFAALKELYPERFPESSAPASEPTEAFRTIHWTQDDNGKPVRHFGPIETCPNHVCEYERPPHPVHEHHLAVESKAHRIEDQLDRIEAMLKTLIERDDYVEPDPRAS